MKPWFLSGWFQAPCETLKLCKMLLLPVKTVMRESWIFELAHLKKRLGDFLVWYFVNVFSRHQESCWS